MLLWERRAATERGGSGLCRRAAGKTNGHPTSGQERITEQRQAEAHSKHSPVQVQLVGLRYELLTQYEWSSKPQWNEMNGVVQVASAADRYLLMNAVSLISEVHFGASLCSPNTGVNTTQESGQGKWPDKQTKPHPAPIVYSRCFCKMRKQINEVFFLLVVCFFPVYC